MTKWENIKKNANVNIKENANPRIPKRYRNDIPTIIEKWGELTDGKIIETTLAEIFGIIEREYRKVISYSGLVNFLKKAYNVTLRISSNKNKGQRSVSYGELATLADKFKRQCLRKNIVFPDEEVENEALMDFQQ